VPSTAAPATSTTDTSPDKSRPAPAGETSAPDPEIEVQSGERADPLE